MNSYNPNIEVLVLDDNGTNLGRMTLNSAQTLAIDRNLDLVQVNKNQDNFSVYKIMDQGKWQYVKKKASKKSSSHSVKEMNFRVSIDVHDKETKINHIKRFLFKGMDVKISIQMRGREKSNPTLAREKMDEILSELDDLIQIKQRKSSGSLITAVVRPKGKLNATEESHKESDQNSDHCGQSSRAAAV